MDKSFTLLKIKLIQLITVSMRMFTPHGLWFNMTHMPVQQVSRLAGDKLTSSCGFHDSPFTGSHTQDLELTHLQLLLGCPPVNN